MTGDLGSGLARFRGVTLAALTTLLTVLGHQVGGGALPDLALVVALFPMLAAVLVTSARRCATLLGVTVTLAAGQVVLHELLVALHPGHVPATLSAVDMVVVHAVATGVTAVLVRGADRALVAVAAGVRRVVPRRPVVLPVVLPLRTPTVAGPAVPLRLVRAATAPMVRRGPPDRR